MSNEKENVLENIIDDTYNGAKYPIIERDYNAYYFPLNYNPDNIESLSENEKVKIYDKANPK